MSNQTSSLFVYKHYINGCPNNMTSLQIIIAMDEHMARRELPRFDDLGPNCRQEWVRVHYRTIIGSININHELMQEGIA